MTTEGQRIIRIGKSLGLTPKEAAIVALIHCELTEKEIADRQGNSRHTIHGHIRRIVRKLKVKRPIGCAVLWERARHGLFRLTQSGHETENLNRGKLAA